jgi:hypothetical protein
MQNDTENKIVSELQVLFFSYSFILSLNAQVPGWEQRLESYCRPGRGKIGCQKSKFKLLQFHLTMNVRPAFCPALHFS